MANQDDPRRTEGAPDAGTTGAEPGAQTNHPESGNGAVSASGPVKKRRKRTASNPNGTADAPTEKHGFMDYLKEFRRPAYHFHKIKEDVKASVHALRNRDLEILKGDVDSLAHAIRGRLFATYFLVGPFGALGPIVGTYYQYWIAPLLPFASLTTFIVTIVVGNVFSAIGFQTIWSVSARTLYKHNPPLAFDWLAMWRDILPLQWEGAKRWAGANIVLMPLSVIAFSLIDRFIPIVGKTVPVAVLVPTLELFFVHTSLIRLMGDLFETESWRIADNHAHWVEEEG